MRATDREAGKKAIPEKYKIKNLALAGVPRSVGRSATPYTESSQV